MIVIHTDIPISKADHHNGTVAFTTWAACFRVILGSVAYKLEWGKAKMANSVTLPYLLKAPSLPLTNTSYERVR